MIYSFSDCFILSQTNILREPTVQLFQYSTKYITNSNQNYS